MRIFIINQFRVFLAAASVLVALSTAEARSLFVDQRKSELFIACQRSDYSFTPVVREAFLAYVKVAAVDELKEQGRPIPERFLKWVDSDPVIKATIYGVHSKPADVLTHFFSLSMDVGRENLQNYSQLLLAAAIVAAKEGATADITRRPPLTLTISGDPRILVDTKDPKRTLDVHDHVINFLNENTIEGYVVAGGNEVLPELKYDKHGIAIPPEVEVVPSTGQKLQKRSLYAADVIASAELQKKFNAYMKSKGFPVDIDCGEKIIHWKASEMVIGEMNKKIDAAYNLFKAAYEEKGLLPKERDPAPSFAERCAYLIRNHEHKFKSTEQRNRNWPRFPLTAPWPVLTLLVADKQPLRENEERWLAFRDEGIFQTYGEYIGGVAQQYNMQSARRICPYPFTYGSVQMMLKDGGVCGTMANISVRSHNTLGIPSTTAGQPGHCALISFNYDAKQKFYSCRGGQYATGGDEDTHPHTRWFFGDEAQQRRMIYHQSIAFAVNYGMTEFLDSLMICNLFDLMPEAERKTKGVKLLRAGVELNPYSFPAVEKLQRTLDDPQQQIQLFQKLEAALAAAKNKPGCPPEGLYNKTVKTAMFTRINQLPVPNDRIAARMVLSYLEKEQCDVPATLVGYKMKLDGVSTVLRNNEKQFLEHLTAMQGEASNLNDVNGEKMASTLKAVSTCIIDDNSRKKWAAALLRKAEGREKYFGNQYRVATDPAVVMLAEISGKGLPPERELMAPVLKIVSAELSTLVAQRRTLKACQPMAAKIQSVADSLKDDKLKSEWIESLAAVMKGAEDFKEKGATVRDPCATVVAKLRTAQGSE
ncbi:MAG: hypothetical protein PHO37_14050 [Kiritimatiellae bacterium]|nr:hypothetical protein [Kiritimatiellia bacterium]